MLFLLHIESFPLGNQLDAFIVWNYEKSDVCKQVSKALLTRLLLHKNKSDWPDIDIFFAICSPVLQGGAVQTETATVG